MLTFATCHRSFLFCGYVMSHSTPDDTHAPPLGADEVRGIGALGLTFCGGVVAILGGGGAGRAMRIVFFVRTCSAVRSCHTCGIDTHMSLRDCTADHVLTKKLFLLFFLLCTLSFFVFRDTGSSTSRLRLIVLTPAYAHTKKTRLHFFS